MNKLIGSIITISFLFILAPFTFVEASGTTDVLEKTIQNVKLIENEIIKAKSLADESANTNTDDARRTELDSQYRTSLSKINTIVQQSTFHNGYYNVNIIDGTVWDSGVKYGVGFERGINVSTLGLVSSIETPEKAANAVNSIVKYGGTLDMLQWFISEHEVNIHLLKNSYKRLGGVNSPVINTKEAANGLVNEAVNVIDYQLNRLYELRTYAVKATEPDVKRNDYYILTQSYHMYKGEMEQVSYEAYYSEYKIASGFNNIDVTIPGVNINSIAIYSSVATNLGIKTPLSSVANGNQSVTEIDNAINILKNHRKYYNDVYKIVNNNQTLPPYVEPVIEQPNDELTPVPYSKRISLFETVFLYNSPSDSAKTNENINPQTVQAVEKVGEFIRIKTWLGDKYIKPVYHLEGEMEKLNLEITTSERLFLYDNPSEGHKRYENVSPQKLYAYYRINDFYAVKTWLGVKFVKPTFQEEAMEGIIVTTERLKLYNSPNQYDYSGATVSPQTLNVSKRNGEFYEVKTWLGKKWIRPSVDVPVKAEDVNQVINLTARATLYYAPLDNATTSYSLAPQLVTAIQKIGSFYKIKTWLGDYYIKN